MNNGERSRPRVAALVGPYGSGKTTLLESLLSVTGAVGRKGRVTEGNTVGDATPEARARQMSVDMNMAGFTWLDEQWQVLDCPGSLELSAEMRRACMVADLAVVVAEPNLEKVAGLAPIFRFLDALAIPHVVFLNKMDQLTGSDLRTRDVMQALQAASQRPLVLRQVPIREEGRITGYVDLVSERAYRWHAGQASDLVAMPDTVRDREHEARQEMLEHLADFDDHLLEQLLEDVAPDRSEVYRQFSHDLALDLIVPVFLGCADRDHGVRRLLKALRHEAPDAAATAERLLLPEGEPLVQVFKTFHASHAGKLSVARVWRGAVTDGMTLGGERVSGVYDYTGGTAGKRPGAEAGEVVCLGRLENATPGDLLTGEANLGRPEDWPAPPAPLHAIAIQARNKADEVKLTATLQKLVDEDDSLSFGLNTDTGEMLLHGQGPVHLSIATDRLEGRYHLPVEAAAPRVPYRESIRRSCDQHSRFKRQTGGHGQFADVHVSVAPLPRGSGFQFQDRIVGGAIPRNFIPAVEDGARDALVSGPLGFPVVDVQVTLTNGQFHSVDSSEQAFRTAGRQALVEALPKCDPVLLEPILLVTFAAPTDCTSKVQRLISQRRGQILGFDTKPGWPGWDEVKAYMPQAEMTDLIIELRSLTQGLGSFDWTFDHLQELMGKQADRVVESQAARVAAQ